MVLVFFFKFNEKLDSHARFEETQVEKSETVGFLGVTKR